MYRMQAMPASFPAPNPGSAEEAGEKRYEGGADQGNTAAGHELLHALGLGAGVVVAISFQEVDGAPDTEAGAECDHEGLENVDCAVEEIHNTPENRIFVLFILLFIYEVLIRFLFLSVELSACSIFSCKLFCLGILISLFNNLFL